MDKKKGTTGGLQMNFLNGAGVQIIALCAKYQGYTTLTKGTVKWKKTKTDEHLSNYFFGLQQGFLCIMKPFLK